MHIDLEKIDAQLRALNEERDFLETIRQIAKNPERRKKLEGLLSPNGNGNGAKLHLTPPVETVDQSRSPAPPRKYGVMKQYALQVLCSTPQTVKQIVEAMIAKGWQPAAKDPGPSVTEVLINLEKRGEARKAPEKGHYGAFMWIK